MILDACSEGPQKGLALSRPPNGVKNGVLPALPVQALRINVKTLYDQVPKSKKNPNSIVKLLVTRSLNLVAVET